MNVSWADQESYDEQGDRATAEASGPGGLVTLLTGVVIGLVIGVCVGLLVASQVFSAAALGVGR